MADLTFLNLDSWAGRTQHPVEIVGRTKKRVRVKLLRDCPKGCGGDVILVPEHALSGGSDR